MPFLGQAMGLPWGNKLNKPIFLASKSSQSSRRLICQQINYINDEDSSFSMNQVPRRMEEKETNSPRGCQRNNKGGNF